MSTEIKEPAIVTRASRPVSRPVVKAPQAPSRPTTKVDVRIRVDRRTKRRATPLAVSLIGWGMACALGFGGAFGATSILGHVRLEAARQTAKQARIRAVEADAAAAAAESELALLARPGEVDRWSRERGLVTAEPGVGELVARR